MSEASSLIEITASERRLADRVDSGVTGSLVVSDAAGGMAFRNMGEVMEFAKLMAISHVAVPKHLRGNPGACLAVAIQALEWRLSPYAVANKSYSVNDRLAYESQLIQAVILQRAPIVGRFKVTYSGEDAKRTCRVAATLRDGSVVDYTSPPTGSITPKNSPLWKSDPDQQLFYYSGRALCRRHFPDVLLGIYDRDEIETEPRDPGAARDVTPPKRDLAGRLDALAAGPAAAVDHDPTTGEVIEPKKAEASPPEATASAEAGATPSPRRASATNKPAEKPASKPAAADLDAARQRGRDDARSGRARDEVPDDIEPGPMSIAWLEGHDEVTEATDDTASPADDDTFPGDR